MYLHPREIRKHGSAEEVHASRLLQAQVKVEGDGAGAGDGEGEGEGPPGQLGCGPVHEQVTSPEHELPL